VAFSGHRYQHALDSETQNVAARNIVRKNNKKCYGWSSNRTTVTEVQTSLTRSQEICMY